MPFRDPMQPFAVNGMTRVLVVESDAAHAAAIKSALEDLGLAVDTIADGTVALQAAKDSPALIILCVELPKMSGYSICNKLKKNPDTKNVPLIIMSSEATPDIFEQHKKLKTRAEDYLIKPFAMEDLTAKVRQLLGIERFELTSPGGLGSDMTNESDIAADTGEIPILYNEDLPTAGEAEAVAEIEIDETEAFVEAEPAQAVDGEIARETDLAFAALELPGENGVEPGVMEVLAPSEVAQEQPGVPPEQPVGVLPVPTLEVADEPTGAEIDRGMAPATQESDLPLPELPEAPEIEVSDTSPFEDEETRSAPSTFSLPVREPPPQPRAPVARQPEQPDPALQRKLDELERENRRLQEDLQHAQAARPASGESGLGFSRDRELLNLREIINKKEKEILDLKDEQHSKERQILDHKDKVRELERKVRDVEEKLLGVEREIVGANEKAVALQKDKETILERERGLKVRLDDAKKEIDKAYAENDALKGRHKETSERLHQEHGAALAAKGQELQQLREQHAAELDTQRTAHAAELQRLRDQHKGETVRLQDEQTRALAAAQEQSRQALESAESAHRQAEAALQEKQERELQALRASQAEETERLRSDHERVLADERQAAQQEAAERQREHQRAEQGLRDQQAGELDRLNREHGDQLNGVEERQRRDLEEREAKYAGEKEALRTEHSTEIERLQREQEQALQAARDEHARAEQEMREKHAAEMAQARSDHESAEQSMRDKHAGELDRTRREQADTLAGMEARHRGQLEELQGQLGDRENQLRSLTDTQRQTEEALRETRAQVNSLEIQLAGLQENVAEREQTIAQQEKQARLQQDQLLAAYNKIRNDEQLADKAKRAMAIALTLLEEQKKVSAEVGAQPAPVGGPH